MSEIEVTVYNYVERAEVRGEGGVRVYKSLEESLKDSGDALL